MTRGTRGGQDARGGQQQDKSASSSFSCPSLVLLCPLAALPALILLLPPGRADQPCVLSSCLRWSAGPNKRRTREGKQQDKRFVVVSITRRAWGSRAARLLPWELCSIKANQNHMGGNSPRRPRPSISLISAAPIRSPPRSTQHSAQGYSALSSSM